MLSEFVEKHKLNQSFIDVAQAWYEPLAQAILSHHIGAKAPVFIGVNGAQGSGKTTLCAYLCQWLEANGVAAISISLDDFYLSRRQRLQLAKDVHPLLAVRGVPGTHNIPLLQQTLSDLRAGQHPVVLPRFNKATDDCTLPLQTVRQPRVIILEGWCWGVAAQTETELAEPVNTLERIEDADGRWRHYVNQSLATAYQPLYRFMDKWLMLKAPSFDCVYRWRCEQEHKLKAAQAGDGIMSDHQVARFIQYYQRLTQHCLATLPARCDWVFELDSKRHITQLRERG